MLFAYLFIIRLGVVPVPVVVFFALASFALHFFSGNVSPIRLPAGVIVLLLLLLCWTLLSLSLNRTADLFGVTFVVSRLLYIVSAFFVVGLVYSANIARSWDELIMTMIALYLVQSLIALLIFALPDVGASILAIQFLDDLSVDVLDSTIGLRFIGLGAANFGGGVSFGVLMILFCSYVAKHQLYRGPRSYRYALMFLVFFLVGFFIARTAAIGGLLGLAIIFWHGRLSGVTYTGKVLSIIFGIFFLVGVIASADFLERMGTVFEWAFEMFLNYQAGGEFASSSTDQLKSMYILPDHLSTYLIGDGLFMAPDGAGYYKEIDVGYLRLIYYVGVPGMLCFIGLSALLFWQAARRVADRHYRIGLLTVALYFLICNFKGFIDFVVFSALFYAFSEILISKGKLAVQLETTSMRGSLL